MSSNTAAPPSDPTPGDPLPLVVQVGFAGARELYEAETHPDVDPGAFETSVQEQFETVLKKELEDLNSAPHRFLCGVSPVAVGGDTVFTRACRSLGWPQRVFLPQPRDEFLAAVGSKGADFTEEQKKTARELLDSPHVIQERVVSDAADRRDRFHDVNLELVRTCDVLVCLLREGQAGKPGGSHEILELAGKHNRPVLEVRVAVHDNEPRLTTTWHHREQFKPPTLPEEIANATLPWGAKCAPLPDIDDYTRGLKDLASGRANWGRQHFVRRAFVIILAHVLATVCAVVALKLHADVVIALLGAELLLLGTGFGVHRYLHRTRRLERWAITRLAAEVARSVSAVGRFHLHLEYLFTLPMPMSLRPLLETINVLHLRSTRQWAHETWQGGVDKKRDAYVHKRLTSPELKAQIPYNEETHKTSGLRLTVARWTFTGASLTAFLATLIKLVCACRWLDLDHETEDGLKAVMGVLAVVLPVVAVAALSLASAFDLEARHTNSGELLEFLPVQRSLLEIASSTREYSRLLIDTENRLLGETVTWYARRSFLGVS